MSKISKRMRKIAQGIDRSALYGLSDAVAMIKERSVAKFDETVEIAMNLGVDSRHANQMVRGVVTMPNGTGVNVRVAVFATSSKASEAIEAGADIVGGEDLFEIVKSGKIDFDRCIATPDMMPLVGKLGRVLGPRGIMPNLRVGTVTTDVATAVRESKSGAVDFRSEKAGIVHAGIGKVSFDNKKIEENVLAFVSAVLKAKPAVSKGDYVKRITLSSTMGCGIKVDLSSFAV
ncbi:50S ribosomal protein L1 [Candidatus Liberibacter africanus]|uniref:Large ribosomal subunit protein uL1 n=1 Tax=Candidatus Liberibacter africanus PTSAPSY TaxID=1277257 RepID=A0A0G3I3L7_LIBAF|nr:50S ribosomal protein L1 [Candidatus Liberibacter africanus]AKK20451.1 50S ribosomal protein L1 [Candidatus Liberibacter africanus PTSAPSY]QTP64171.1 50S ribosomal protein L1 [Candidatus Liberibacter africanus]